MQVENITIIIHIQKQKGLPRRNHRKFPACTHILSPIKDRYVLERAIRFILAGMAEVERRREWVNVLFFLLVLVVQKECIQVWR
jgi:hypothetical protein